jgi:hypothetical protein
MTKHVFEVVVRLELLQNRWRSVLSLPDCGGLCEPWPPDFLERCNLMPDILRG